MGRWNIGIMALELQKGSVAKKGQREIQAMVRLDLRNLIMPFCLLKASNTFRSLEKGDAMEILCNEPVSLMNLMKVIPSGSFKLISVKDLEGSEQGLKAQFKKISA
jgi:TusA-related sulfurtransferase